jgi:hypothetical protein
MRWRPPKSWPKDGIEAEVIDLRTLRPMDTDAIIASVRRPTAASRSRKASRSRLGRQLHHGGADAAGLRLSTRR